jgi:hypothetical protein
MSGIRNASWRRPAAFVAVAICLTVTACGNDFDRGLSVRIRNGLDEVVVVTYEEPGHEMDVGTFDPGEGTEFSKVFERGPGCYGPLVARTVGGQEVDRTAEMCSGVLWTIAARGSGANP